MTTSVRFAPGVLHELPGRVRLSLPGWQPGAAQLVEAYFSREQGVVRAEANPRTGNVLVYFRPDETGARRLIEHAEAIIAEPFIALGSAAPTQQPDQPPALRERDGGRSRARIAVRGLDRDLRLARVVVRRLERFAGVRATPSPITGRVLVEFAADAVTLEELVAAVADIELPELPDEDRPAHPLDSAPLVLSALRLTAAAVGLALITARQITGRTDRAPGAVRVASILSVFQGTPGPRRVLARLLGREGAEVALALPSIIAHTVAGAPLALVLIAAESLRMVTAIRARQIAWRRYEERIRTAPPVLPGATVPLESGERVPLDAIVIEGVGAAVDEDGLPKQIGPGSVVGAGARLRDGPFIMRLLADDGFVPSVRPDEPAPTLYERYLEVATPLELAYAAGTAIVTRSSERTLAAMLLVNARAAIVGARGADANAMARVARAGAIPIFSRPERRLRKPDVIFLGNARLLADGMEFGAVVTLREGVAADAMLDLAGRVARSADAPWAAALNPRAFPHAVDASYDGLTASATIGAMRYTVRPVRDDDPVPPSVRERHRGEQLLLLTAGDDALAALVLRPRLAPSVRDLTTLCASARIRLAVLQRHESAAARRLAHRAGIPLFVLADPVRAIHDAQTGGRIVMFVSDSATAGAAFAASDLAIGVADLRERFAARVDVLAPDVEAVRAVVEATLLRDDALRDAVGLSAAGNLAGAVLGWRGVRPFSAGRLVESVAIAALGATWLRMYGGERATSVAASLRDPHPEQWARLSPDEVLRALESSDRGLSSEQVRARRGESPSVVPEHRAFLQAVVRQIESPITVIWFGGATISLVLGAGLDVALIVGTLGLNVLVGAWQERKSGRVADALKALERRAVSRVHRDGSVVEVRHDELALGDVLLLAPGDRVGADARLLTATGLEVDEAALTGESLPVPKAPDAPVESARIVLAGSDVTTGHGRAVAVAVGAHTRMGATAAALALQDDRRDVLATRLAQLLREAVPVALMGGMVVTVAGLLRGRSLLAQLTTGTSVVLAAVPEGLPLLAGLGQAAAAQRLSERGAIVRRLTAVEALGRVDVACVDKTGTLTHGQLRVTLVATEADEARLPAALSETMREILLAAALASPHPDAWSAAAHATDLAVIRSAEAAGLGEAIRAPRTQEAAFDPVRAFYATTVDGRLYVKGAPEVLLDRSVAVRRGSETMRLNAEERDALLARATQFAERGLRVLLVAEGSANQRPTDADNLTVLGLLGISDPLRPEVASAVARCRAAGVRVIMLTGDHSATARAIAADAGLLVGEVITGADLAQLDNGELDERLESATVIARATPLDKLRIVESLQRSGHTVAMTGDGVNDAPALRLADVGVAMGRSGTEVARQTADVILTDDDFPTLVEALVEGRGFWGNTRRALGLLLGGNLGELGLIAGTTILGAGSALTVPQILAVNLVTDMLPALAISVQHPEHRNLELLAREGSAAIGAPLRGEIASRAAATAIASLGAFAIAAVTRGAREAQGVAFASVVATQLAQTIGVGQSVGRLTPSVAGAVGVSAVALGAAFAVPTLRNMLGLEPLSPLGWALVTGGTLLAPALNRALVPSSASYRGALSPQPS